MRDERALNLNRAQTMARYIEYIVDATHDPVIAIVVAASVVAGQVHAGHLAPINFLEAIIVAPNPAQHAGPRLRHHQPATLILTHRIASVIDNRRNDSRQRHGATARLRWDRTGQ